MRHDLDPVAAADSLQPRGEIQIALVGAPDVFMEVWSENGMAVGLQVSGWHPAVPGWRNDGGVEVAG